MTISKPEAIAWEVRTLSDPKALGISPSYPEWAERDADLSITPLIRLRDYEALQAEFNALRDKTSLSLGVGDGTGNLFVHGDYDSIKRVQELIFECEQLRKDAEFGRSVLAKREPGKAYGCHCDLEEGMEPDGCVIDSGERLNCIYAKDISVKEQCEYWRVIASDVS